jgi:hypothetical protein
MKTVPFSAILAESCQLIGLDRNTLNDKSFAAIRDFTNRRLSMIWDREDWPDIQDVTQLWPGTRISNVVADPIELLTEAGNELLQEDSQPLYTQNTENTIPVVITLDPIYPRVYLRDFSEQAWQKGTIGESNVNIINPFFILKEDGTLSSAGATQYTFTFTVGDETTDPYITSITIQMPWGTSQWTPISGSTLEFVNNPQPLAVVAGQAIGCWTHDPRKGTRGRDESFIVENMPNLDINTNSTMQMLSQDLFVLRFPNFATKFVLLRQTAPFLFGTRYDATLAYSAGSQVYYDPGQGSSAYNPPSKNLPVAGNFWNAYASAPIGVLPANPSTSWALSEIPFRFKGYLVNAVSADFLRSEGRATEADSLESMAEFALQQQIDVLIRQQGQIQRMNMVYTY